MRVIAAALPLLVASACAPTHAPSLTQAGQAVAVYDEPAAVPASCEVLKEVTVRDGNAQHGNFVYDGTKEGALIRLRNLAASKRADAVVVIPDPGKTMICVDCTDGSYAWITGRLLRCAPPTAPPTSATARPLPRTSRE